LATLVGLWLGAGPVHAQEGSGEQISAPLLWQVDGPAGPSYLFGTIHMGIAAEGTLPPVVWDRLAQCHTLVTEADIRSLDPMTTLNLVTLPEGQSASALIDPVTWAALVAELSAQFPEPLLHRFQPWFIATLLTIRLFPQTTPMEDDFLTRAEAAGQTLLFLETLEEQMGFLNTQPLEPVLLDLRELVTDRPTAVAQIEALLGAYRSGDVEALSTAFFVPETLAIHLPMYEHIIYQRNRNWIESMVPWLNTGGYFIAVGAGHLLGEQSVLRMLEQRGFRISRVVP
jgi:uncharacterized protein YbaP (TraB family)